MVNQDVVQDSASFIRHQGITNLPRTNSDHLTSANTVQERSGARTTESQTTHVGDVEQTDRLSSRLVLVHDLKSFLSEAEALALDTAIDGASEGA